MSVQVTGVSPTLRMAEPLTNPPPPRVAGATGKPPLPLPTGVEPRGRLYSLPRNPSSAPPSWGCVSLKTLARGGGDGEAAVARHDSCDALGQLELHARIPQQRAVVVGVRIDEARRERRPAGIDLLPCITTGRAHPHDSPILHGHVAVQRGT